MADPTPSHGLPEKEYVEIYNQSEDTLLLNNYSFQYGDNVPVRLVREIIFPQEYVLLCRVGNGAELLPYGKVVELPRFSLLNAGTTLKLLDSKDQAIHTVTYNASWYSAERDQGYSLELIDAQYFCVGQGNWTSSRSENGGTPGKLNSVAAPNPDVKAPELLRWEFLNDTLTILFNEPIEPTFSIDLDGQQVILVEHSKDQQAIQVVLDAPGLSFTCSLSNVRDCSGNTADRILIRVENLPLPSFGDVVISEILFNPKIGGEDFIELAKVTENAVNDQRLFLARERNGELSEMHELLKTSNESENIFWFSADPNTVALFYPNAQLNKAFQAELPSMPNSEAKLLLFNAAKQKIDEVMYQESWHSEGIDFPEGVSLKRIDLGKSGLSETNWQSSSGLEGFATPGYLEFLGEGKKVYLVDRVITPDGDGIKDKLEIVFPESEKVGFLSLEVFNSSGISMEKLENNVFMGSNGLYSWEPATNDTSKWPTGYYYLLLEIRDSMETKKLRLPFVIAYTP